LTYRESLRDIEACLRSLQGKLYHLGFRGHVSRSTLADANENRDWRIFAAFAQVLIGIARPLYAHDPMGVDLEQSLYALDSTTIDLCLSLFPWARFRKHKAAVKMHTLLDLHGNIPTFIRVTEGKLHDVNILDELLPEAGAFYVMDRGYIDFEPFHLHALLRLLRRAYQRERPASTPLFAPGRQSHRPAIRPHRHPHRDRFGQGVSRSAAAPHLLRCRERKAAQVPHQQFCAACTDDRANLQMPLAGGVVLQVDQAAPANQSVLRYQRECREDSNLDRRLRICARGHRPEASRPGGEPLPNSTDFESYAFRKNAHFTSA